MPQKESKMNIPEKLNTTTSEVKFLGCQHCMGRPERKEREACDVEAFREKTK